MSSSFIEGKPQQPEIPILLIGDEIIKAASQRFIKPLLISL
jgi:hypothetical protein